MGYRLSACVVVLLCVVVSVTACNQQLLNACLKNGGGQGCYSKLGCTSSSGGSILSAVRSTLAGTTNTNNPKSGISGFFGGIVNTVRNVFSNVFGGSAATTASAAARAPTRTATAANNIWNNVAVNRGVAQPNYATRTNVPNVPYAAAAVGSGAASIATAATAASTNAGGTGTGLVYCDKVSAAFITKVRQVCSNLGITDCNWLMAAMAFETGRSFSPAQRNAAGSSATGLIQFMSSTARNLGTSTNALAAMTAVQQLDYVQKYFQSYKGRLKSLEDVYMAILWPAAVGRGAGHVLFSSGKQYTQNQGLDVNKDHKVTVGEATYKVRQVLNEGLAANPPCLHAK